MKRILCGVLVFSWIIYTQPSPVKAATASQKGKASVAIMDFEVDPEISKNLGTNLSDQIRDRVAKTGIFNVIDPNHNPAAQAKFVLSGKIARADNQKYTLSLKLVNVETSESQDYAVDFKVPQQIEKKNQQVTASLLHPSGKNLFSTQQTKVKKFLSNAEIITIVVVSIVVIGLIWLLIWAIGESSSHTHRD